MQRLVTYFHLNSLPPSWWTIKDSTLLHWQTVTNQVRLVSWLRGGVKWKERERDAGLATTMEGMILGKGFVYLPQTEWSSLMPKPPADGAEFLSETLPKGGAVWTALVEGCLLFGNVNICVCLLSQPKKRSSCESSDLFPRRASYFFWRPELGWITKSKSWPLQALLLTQSERRRGCVWEFVLNARIKQQALVCLRLIFCPPPLSLDHHVFFLLCFSLHLKVALWPWGASVPLLIPHMPHAFKHGPQVWSGSLIHHQHELPIYYFPSTYWFSPLLTCFWFCAYIMLTHKEKSGDSFSFPCSLSSSRPSLTKHD